jgi:hypothetical protein
VLEHPGELIVNAFVAQPGVKIVIIQSMCTLTFGSSSISILNLPLLWLSRAAYGDERELNFSV